MKRKLIAPILSIAFFFATSATFGQNPTLHIYATKCALGRGISTFELFLNGKFATNINADEILEYKLHSKGRFAVTVKLSQDTKFDGVVNIDNNEDYYVIADLKKTFKVMIVDKAQWDKFTAKLKSSPSKLEEDINNPFGKL